MCSRWIVFNYNAVSGHLWVMLSRFFKKLSYIPCTIKFYCYIFGYAMNQFQTLLQALTKGGSPDIKEQTWMLDDGLEITLADEGEDILGLYCVLYIFEDMPPSWMLSELCLANYGCAGTQGATLGFDDETGSVLLTRFWPIKSMELPQMLYIVNLFAETASLWSKRLAQKDIEHRKQGSSQAQKTETFSIEHLSNQHLIRI